jgi:hypothetical protein
MKSQPLTIRITVHDGMARPKDATFIVVIDSLSQPQVVTPGWLTDHPNVQYKVHPQVVPTGIVQNHVGSWSFVRYVWRQTAFGPPWAY